MNPQHTEDYKQTAVKYYLEHNEDITVLSHFSFRSV